jgi:hypothetical protein
MLPTADSVPSQVWVSATAVPTVSGGAPALAISLPKFMSVEICVNLIPTSAATSARRPRMGMR